MTPRLSCLNKPVAHQRQGGHSHQRLKYTHTKKPETSHFNLKMKGYRRFVLDRKPLLPRLYCCCCEVQDLAALSSSSCSAAAQNPLTHKDVLKSHESTSACTTSACQSLSEASWHRAGGGPPTGALPLSTLTTSNPDSTARAAATEQGRRAAGGTERSARCPNSNGASCLGSLLPEAVLRGGGRASGGDHCRQVGVGSRVSEN